MKAGVTVKFRVPLDEAERTERYTLLEDPAEAIEQERRLRAEGFSGFRANVRCRAVCDLPIPPVCDLALEDIEVSEN